MPLEVDLSLLAINSKSDSTKILVINTIEDDVIPLNALREKSINTFPTVEKLITKYALEEYCKAASLNVGHAGSVFNN